MDAEIFLECIRLGNGKNFFVGHGIFGRGKFLLVKRFIWFFCHGKFLLDMRFLVIGNFCWICDDGS